MHELDFLTATQIAKRINATGERVRHVLRSREIEPVARAGGVRLFDTEACDRVRTEIEQMKTRAQ